MRMLNENSGLPLVSVIMPAYNAATTIKESIQSVLDQDYTSFELIVVDDNSSDATVQIVSTFTDFDPRVRVVKNGAGKGAASARNFGIGLAIGRYLAFLDADDGWHKSKLSMQIGFMSSKAVGFTFTSYFRFRSKYFSSEQLVKAPSHVSYQELLKGNSIGCLTVVIDRQLVSNIKFPEIEFDQKDFLRKFIGPALGHEDYALWLSLLKQNNGLVAQSLQAPLAFYRVSSTSLSGNKFNSALKHWAVLRRFLKLSFFSSIWYFINYVVKVFVKYKSNVL